MNSKLQKTDNNQKNNDLDLKNKFIDIMVIIVISIIKYLRKLTCLLGFHRFRYYADKRTKVTQFQKVKKIKYRKSDKIHQHNMNSHRTIHSRKYKCMYCHKTKDKYFKNGIVITVNDN